MDFRVKFSAILLLTGFILAVLPLSGNRSLTVKPGTVLSLTSGSDRILTADQVARMIVSEDSLMRLIDLRPEKEFLAVSIPGAVNVPYKGLADTDPTTYLGEGMTKNIFYSNDDYNSNFAMVYATGLGYENCYVMKGGLNEWFRTVMNSEFSGERISARENALFETRAKAKKLFTEINSLPDSLKLKFLDASRFDPKKLDGGCE